MGVELPPPFVLSPDGYAMIKRSDAWVVSEVDWKADVGIIRRQPISRPL